MYCCVKKESTFNFIWRIENFCLCKSGNDFYLESPVFIPLPFPYNGTKLRLRFYPRRENQCSCYLIIETRDAGIGEITFSYYLEIIGTNDDVLKFQVKTCKLLNGEGCAWPGFIGYQHILDNRNKFLVDDCLTIHFHVSGEKEVLNIYPTIARTEIIAEKCSLTWSICNFSLCVSRKTKFSFPSGHSYGLTFDTSDDDIKITISPKGCASSRFLRCEIFLQDSVGARKWSKLQEHQFVDNNEIWEFPSFLKKSKLESENGNFLMRDMLCLYCKFALSTGEVQSVIESHFEKVSGTRDIPLHSLQEDLQNMFVSKKMTDVKFKVDDKMLPAHKFILAARSPVFSAMFEQEMLENKSGIVDIPDINYETLEELLAFMYGAKLENLNFERAMKLVVAADKYQVLSLKDECSMFLKLNLCEENFPQILALSDMLQDGILKRSATEYFKRHKKTILLTADWKELVENNMRLVTEVLTISALEE